MDFQGKTAIITGASVGLGRAVARQMAAGHAALALVDIDAEKLHALCEELAATGATVYEYVCSVADEQAITDVCRDAEEKFGKVDILVNNAGIYRCDVMPFNESESAFWKKKIDVNILGTLYPTRAVVNGMIERGYGRIVNISSVAAVYGIVNMVDYSMTKGAIVGFTKALAKELTPYGITVNAVAPGTIGDESHESDFNFLGRTGTSEECANMVCFLASDDAVYISGQNYVVDGCRRRM